MENGRWGIFAVVLLPEMLEQQQPGCFLVGCSCYWVPRAGLGSGVLAVLVPLCSPPSKGICCCQSPAPSSSAGAPTWCCMRAEVGALLWMSWVVSPHLACAPKPVLCPQDCWSWGQSSCRHNIRGGWRGGRECMQQSGMLGGRRATRKIWANSGVRRGLESVTAARAAPREALHCELEGGIRGASPRVWRLGAGRGQRGCSRGWDPRARRGRLGARGPSRSPEGRSLRPRCRLPCPCPDRCPAGCRCPGPGRGGGRGRSGSAGLELAECQRRRREAGGSSSSEEAAASAPAPGAASPGPGKGCGSRVSAVLVPVVSGHPSGCARRTELGRSGSRRVRGTAVSAGSRGPEGEQRRRGAGTVPGAAGSPGASPRAPEKTPRPPARPAAAPGARRRGAEVTARQMRGQPPPALRSLLRGLPVPGVLRAGWVHG